MLNGRNSLGVGMISPLFGQLVGYTWLDVFQVASASVSLILNSVLLLANYRRGDGRWETDGILCTITAMADCTISVYLILSTAVRLADEGLLYDDSTWCRVNYIVMRSMAVICLNIAALLSLVRYLVIVRGQSAYPRRWTLVALSFVVLLTGLTVHRSMRSPIYVFPSKLYCSPIDVSPSLQSQFVGYTIQFFSTLPVFVIPFCYARVSLYYSRLVSNLEENTFSYKARFRIHRKIMGILLIAVAYMIAVIPDYLAFILSRHFRVHLSDLVVGIAWCLANCVSLLNAIFPLFFHEEIKKNAYKMLPFN